MPDARPVDTNPRGKQPMKLGRAEVAGGRTETIQESKYPDGQTRHGINMANVHGRDRHRYKDGEAYRASQRSSPYPK